MSDPGEAATALVRGIVVAGSRSLVSLRLDPADDPTPKFVFQLHPWRTPGEAPRDSRLRVSVRTHEPLARWSERVADDALIEFEAELDADRGLAQMHGMPRTAADSELAAAGERAKAGVELADPRFGVFRYDRRVDLFTATVDWLGKPATLHLEVGKGDAQAMLADAHRFFDEAELWDARARAAIVDALYELWNGTWRDDEDPELDRAAFLDRIVIESVGLNQGGTRSLVYADGDLFAGHWIDVTIHPDTGEVIAELAG